MKMNCKLLPAAMLLLTTAGILGQITLPDDVVRVAGREYRFGQPNDEPVWDPPLLADHFPALSADGLTLWFGSTRPGGLGGFDFWICTRPTLASAWSEPVNPGPPINSPNDENGARFSPDGLAVYFASNRSGGLGDFDIWVATRPALTQPFSTPVNLGSAINSDSLDFFATTSADHLTLIFFSDRPGGPGELDLWMSTRASATAPWEEARALAEPINSPNWDTAPLLSADGLTLFFASNRPPSPRLYPWIARRPDTRSPFADPSLIQTIMDPVDQRSREPISLSADGATFYYAHFHTGGADRGGGILSRVSITPLPQLQDPSSTDRGQFEFDLLGREGAAYTIETSSDLRTWVPWLATNTTDRVRLTNSVSSDSKRFFRTVAP